MGPDYSQFIILLARQRSGTHALRSILESHPDIFGVEEPFHLKTPDDPGTGETNFFVFLKRVAHIDPLRLIAADYEPLFLEYLQHLRGFSAKRYLLLDVKLNSVHHILKRFQPLFAPPHLFELILKHGLRTFVLTRKNYLRYYLSIAKARASDIYHVNAAPAPHLDAKIHVNPAELALELNRCAAEDAFVHDCFTIYANTYWGYNFREKYFTRDYAEIFTATENGAAPEFLERFAGWLGISNNFQNFCAFQKQSSLPLKEAIVNYREVARCLRRTPFKYCLVDEEVYRPPRVKRGKPFGYLSLPKRLFSVEGLGGVAKRNVHE